jgi:glycosyltransferase involved in cell wall biosynthesis
VNVPINRKTWYSKNKSAGVEFHCSLIRNKQSGLKRVHDKLWEFYPPTIIESINWIPSTTIFRIINQINNKRFASDIRKAVNESGFKDIILFNDNDFFNGYDLKELLSPQLYIYYSRDFLTGFSYYRKHGRIVEPELIAKADVAVANSVYLADYCKEFNSKSFYIGQGCKLDLFDPALKYKKPDELSGIASPVIGYVGAITSERLDIEIIRQIAAANPAWNVVLVGPEDEVFRNSDLHQMPNVYFTGKKPMDLLPAFINYFDVCINPQLINPVTIGNYPLKVDEYLAMGKPVVATRTKTMELFSDHTYLAQRPEQYPEMIRKALSENSEELATARIRFARSHSWENCMIELYRVISAEASVKSRT